MHGADEATIFKCRIIQPPVTTPKNYKFYVSVEEQLRNSSNSVTTGKALIYLKADSASKYIPQYGDVIYIPNHFSEPTAPKNPAGFNYKNYLNYTGIYHVAYLQTGDVYFDQVRCAKWQWKQIYACRNYFIRLMDRYIENDNSRTVGEALILGTKSDIDEGVQQAYANTGTMHILAVSGLHVGILFVILEFLFKPLKFFQKKRSRAALIKTVFILLIIWIYACLTGMSPSVMRSAVMFTFLAFGRLFDRHIDSFNIIFISMLPLLIMNPYQIMQVGFQLSYLAVAGIVFFQPLFARLWKPGNRFLKYIWSLTTVSIAAQLATVPVSTFYFHQFPNYFLLSNMIAIPVSFIVLILGVAFFVLGWMPFVNAGLGYLLDQSLRLLNGSVLSVDRLPYAVTYNLQLNFTETILTYIAIFLFGAFISLKHKKYFIRMLCMICLITISISARHFQNNARREILFYNTKSSSAIAVKDGTQCYVLTNSDSLYQSDDYTYNLKNHFIVQGIHHPQFLDYTGADTILSIPGFYFHYPFLLAGAQTFYFLTKSNQKDLIEHADEIDFVILNDNPFLKIDSSMQFKHAVFIIDNSNNWKSVNYWKKAFDKNGIQYKSVKDEYVRIEY